MNRTGFEKLTRATSTVESIIDGDAPLRALDAHFPDREAALRVYVDAMQRRYSPGVVNGRCTVCTLRPATGHVRVDWLAFYYRRIGRATLKTLLRTPLIIWAAISAVVAHHVWSISKSVGEEVEIHMTTHHPVCSRCRWGLRARLPLASLVSYALGLVALAGLVVAVFGAFGIVLETFDPSASGKSLMPTAVRCLIGGAGVTTGMLLLKRRLPAAVALPRAIRRVGRRPFTFQHPGLLRW